MVHESKYVENAFFTLMWRSTFPCGLVVRIWRSHRHGPDSIPGMGTLFVDPSCNFSGHSNLSLIIAILLPSWNGKNTRK